MTRILALMTVAFLLLTGTALADHNDTHSERQADSQASCSDMDGMWKEHSVGNFHCFVTEAAEVGEVQTRVDTTDEQLFEIRVDNGNKKGTKDQNEVWLTGGMWSESVVTYRIDTVQTSGYSYNSGNKSWNHKDDLSGATTSEVILDETEPEFVFECEKLNRGAIKNGPKPCTEEDLARVATALNT